MIMITPVIYKVYSNMEIAPVIFTSSNLKEALRIQQLYEYIYGIASWIKIQFLAP